MGLVCVGPGQKMGQLAGETVNVDMAAELGTEAMKQFESKWPTGFDEKISIKLLKPKLQVKTSESWQY